MKVYEVPFTLAMHHSDIKIKASCTIKMPQSFVTRFCAYNRLRYQVSIYRTIGPRVQSWGHKISNEKEENTI